MSKPKIALLERDAKDWGPEEMLPLLRLARAAKNACGQVIARSDHEYRTRLELQQSLDAFDWGDE